MSWEDFEWPDLSSSFPTPQPGRRPPRRPAVPSGIGADIAHAERRRKRLVLLCLWTGMLVFAAGVLVYSPVGEGRVSATLGLCLLALGLLLLFPVAALLALWLGPHWRQRQDHWSLLHWQSAHWNWLADERKRYLELLSPQAREALQGILASHNHKSMEHRWQRVELVDQPETALE
jgi:hypothetical protein